MEDRPHQLRLALFRTKPVACSYLPGNEWVSIVVDPRWPLRGPLYSVLIAQGFRRSGEYIYRPHCPECVQCVPVRRHLLLSCPIAPYPQVH